MKPAVLAAALAGLLLAVQKLSGYSLNGIGLELDAIAAAVIGGVLLSGGVGVALLLYYRLVHGGRAIARRPSPA